MNKQLHRIITFNTLITISNIYCSQQPAQPTPQPTPIVHAAGLPQQAQQSRNRRRRAASRYAAAAYSNADSKQDYEGSSDPRYLENSLAQSIERMRAEQTYFNTQQFIALSAIQHSVEQQNALLTDVLKLFGAIAGQRQMQRFVPSMHAPQPMQYAQSAPNANAAAANYTTHAYAYAPASAWTHPPYAAAPATATLQIAGFPFAPEQTAAPLAQPAPAAANPHNKQ